jgi:hypothetical protein
MNADEKGGSEQAHAQRSAAIEDFLKGFPVERQFTDEELDEARFQLLAAKHLGPTFAAKWGGTMTKVEDPTDPILTHINEKHVK